MTFRRRVRLNPGQVRDLRGGAAGMPGRGLALAGGGGVVGLVVLALFVLMGGDLGPISPEPAGGRAQLETTSGSLEDCQTGADANERLDCRIVGFANSIQVYWHANAELEGIRYEEAPTTLFDSAVSTACGYATSDVGPFYCPLDASVYLDLTFFEDLRWLLGAQGGPMAQAYVVAHEYGHHVQNLRGVLDAGQRDTGPGGHAVATELQADCYAGAWTAEAADTGFLEPPSREEVAVALDAAAAVGDDRIQRRATGELDPESWTHGSSQQRQDWFLIGYRSGDPTECRP
jgi:predicted metalloprotease